jgi:F0F1-type ATP synthase membrane subunit b/b'
MSDIIQIFIQSNTLNFLIVLFILVFLVKKLKVSEKIEKLSNEIKSYVESSETEKQQAQAELGRIKDKISKLPALSERIKKSTQRNINNIAENAKKHTEIQKQDITNNAQRLFKLETRLFKSKLTNLLSEASIQLAKENAIKQLEENPELHNRYIEKAIEELDGIN